MLKDKMNKEIVSLLLISKIPILEKKIWVTVLPEMNEEEKKKLRDNLVKEVEYEAQVEEKALEQFLEALKKQAPK